MARLVKVLAPAFAVVALVGCGRSVGTGGADTTETVLQVEGSSMEPTLHCARPGFGCRGKRDDDLVIRAAAQIERGQVVAFRAGAHAREQCGAGGLFVKRVIALAGERVSFTDGEVHVGGRRLREPYAHGPTEPGTARQVVVPPRHVFVLGDSRSESCDSRFWGPLAIRRIVGVGAAIQRGGRRIPLP